MKPFLRPVLATALLAGVVPLVASAQAEPAGLVADDVRLVTTVPGATGGHAVVEGDRLYVGAYGAGMRLFDIKDPQKPVELGRFVPGPQPDQPDNDAGVRADAVPDAAVLDGRHIVTLNGTGRTAGAQQTEFLDWTDPAEPKLLFRFTGADDGESHNGDIVDARRWWVPSGRVDFRVYDLSPLLGATPAAPQRLAKVNPRELWERSPYRAGRPVGGPSTVIHDIEVYAGRDVLLPPDRWVDADGDGTREPTRARRDIALVAEGGTYLTGNDTGSLYVLDITDPARPVALLRHQRKPGDGRRPQRYVHEAQFLQGQSDVIVTTDEDLHSGCDNGGIATFRVSEDLTQIQELAQWFIGTGTPAAVCSVHVMSTKDDYAFFGSYSAGLQVVDLSDPAKPVRAGQFIAPGMDSWGALVHPDVPGYLTYVGDFGGRGLDVLEFLPDTAQGVVTGNPATTQVSGVDETVCEQTGAPAPATVDALVVPVPPARATGESTLRAVGEGLAPRDLRVYFYDRSCRFLPGASLNSDDPDAVGPVPEGAAFAAVTNALPGPPSRVFVEIR